MLRALDEVVTMATTIAPRHRVARAPRLAALLALGSLAATSSTDPVVVGTKPVIHVSGSTKKVTSATTVKADIKVFPVPSKPSSYVCKRVDIAVIPYGRTGFGSDGGEVYTKGGCGTSDPQTLSASFLLVPWAKERAEELCKTKNPTGASTVKVPMLAAYEVRRRYCFLDMKGNHIPGGTQWATDCEKDGVWITKAVPFPVDVVCDKAS